MKNPLSLLALFFTITFPALSQKANEIDLLKTDADVSDFWQKNVSANKKKLPLVPFYTGRIQVNDSLGAKNWIKTDFDGNGETDLLIFRVEGITEILIVLSKNGKYKLIKPSYSNNYRYQFIYPITKKINKLNLILLYNQHQVGIIDETENKLYTKLECDTLTFKYNRVLNYSSHPHKYDISCIILENNGSCEGDCPKTTVIIDSKNFSSTAIKKNNGKSYSGSLDKQSIKDINNLLSYANFPNLNSEYKAKDYDLTTTTLTVLYNGGKKKVIKDYGSTGSFTLSEIYKITGNINWTAIH